MRNCCFSLSLFPFENNLHGFLSAGADFGPVWWGSHIFFLDFDADQRANSQGHEVSYFDFLVDDHRLREGHGPENLSTMRKMALIMLKRVNHKRGIKNKRRKAGWDNQFLELIFKEFLEV